MKLVFGARGQLGSELLELLAVAKDDVIGLTREDVDVSDHAAVRRVIEEHGPTVVFNCTAYNAVDKAEKEMDAALAINALAPASMASACRSVDARFVHFSTDYVFGDGHEVPIDESHSPTPLSAYGRSKRLGEQMALQNHTRSLVIRYTCLYGHLRANFVRTMIKYGSAGKRLQVVNDQFVSPTWVRPLAKVSLALVERELSGVFHAVSHGGCTWYDLAQKTFDLLDIDADLHPTTQEEWGAPARRPTYSVLDNALLRSLNLDGFEDWERSLEAFISEFREELLSERS